MLLLRRLILRRVNRLLVSLAKELSEEAALLLRSGTGRRGGRAIGGGGGRQGGYVGLRRIHCVHGWRVPQAEYLLKQVALVASAAGGIAAGVEWLRPIKERCHVIAGARSVGLQVGHLVQLHLEHAFRWKKLVGVGILRQLDRPLHEVGPDGSRRESAHQFHVGIVIVPDPDDADEVRGVASEPYVVAGAGLACGRGHEAALAGLVAVAEVHHALQQAGGQEGGALVQHLMRVRRVVGENIAVGVAHRGQHPGVDVDAVVRKDSVCAGHIKRRGVIRAKGDGWSSPRRLDAGLAGKLSDVLEADHLAEGDGRVVQRVRQGVDGSDFAVELVLEVARRVGLAAIVEGEGGGLVVQACYGGEGA